MVAACPAQWSVCRCSMLFPPEHGFGEPLLQLDILQPQYRLALQALQGHASSKRCLPLTLQVRPEPVSVSDAADVVHVLGLQKELSWEGLDSIKAEYQLLEEVNKVGASHTD